jgi:hypothetical protein
MIRRLAALALLCSAASACDSATDADPAARYALVVNPPVVIQNESVRIELLQDRLALNEDGSARREVTQRYDFVSPAVRDTTETFVETYHYDVNGATIELTALCPPNALCIEGPHLWGRVTADGLELRTHLDPDVVLAYRRLVP